MTRYTPRHARTQKGSPMQEIVNGNPALRRTLYTVYAVAGLILGATQVGFSAAEAGQPLALTVALAVYGFLGTAFGFAARSKTDATPAPQSTVYRFHPED